MNVLLNEKKGFSAKVFHPNPTEHVETYNPRAGIEEDTTYCCGACKRAEVLGAMPNRIFHSCLVKNIFMSLLIQTGNLEWLKKGQKILPYGWEILGFACNIARVEIYLFCSCSFESTVNRIL